MVIQHKSTLIVEDYLEDLKIVCLVEEAMELLNDGYPIPSELQNRLQEVGIDSGRFIEIHQDKIG